MDYLRSSGSPKRLLDSTGFGCGWLLLFVVVGGWDCGWEDGLVFFMAFFISPGLKTILFDLNFPAFISPKVKKSKSKQRVSDFWKNERKTEKNEKFGHFDDGDDGQNVSAKSLKNLKATGVKDRAAALETSSRDAGKYPRCLNPASDKRPIAARTPDLLLFWDQVQHFWKTHLQISPPKDTMLNYCSNSMHIRLFITYTLFTYRQSP